MVLPAEIAELLAEPGPCDCCPWSQHCKANETACSAYLSFVNGETQETWTAKPRRPSRALFLRSTRSERTARRKAATLAEFIES